MEAPSTTDTTKTRRVLGDLSPNVKPITSSANQIGGNKSLTGSPLKRSFTASIEGGHGFTYLKKRRLSADRTSSQRMEDSRGEQSLTSGRLQELESKPRPVQTESTGQINIPSIQQLSPTEPNTPTPSSSPEEANDSSAERKSFSSLINYEPSSQSVPQARSKLVFSGPSYAEILRLRLRMAMFKVRTNQVNVPFGELRVDNAHGRTILQPTAEQVEEAVAMLRREAQLSDLSARQKSMSKLLPAPVLRPTAFSSRKISDWRVPSSPPIVESLDGISPPSTARRSTWPDESTQTGSSVKERLEEGARNSV